MLRNAKVREPSERERPAPPKGRGATAPDTDAILAELAAHPGPDAVLAELADRTDLDAVLAELAAAAVAWTEGGADPSRPKKRTLRVPLCPPDCGGPPGCPNPKNP